MDELLIFVLDIGNLFMINLVWNLLIVFWF